MICLLCVFIFRLMFPLWEETVLAFICIWSDIWMVPCPDIHMRNMFDSVWLSVTGV